MDSIIHKNRHLPEQVRPFSPLGVRGVGGAFPGTRAADFPSLGVRGAGRLFSPLDIIFIRDNH
jgi:hypothetical protein